MRHRWPMLLTLSAACAVASQAQAPDGPLSKSSLEELTQVKIKVSSASRKDEDLDETPAAVYVITREDIAHSSASSIPELLRAVPGLQVAQITASTWAVSARGFNSAFANKLLVLIDGRTMYSEIFAGVRWDEIDLPLETIDHIEVIRGAGAAVWGANAANGVINILTLPPRSAQGTSVSAKDSRVQGTMLAQKGGLLGDLAQYRAYASYTNRRPLVNPDGSSAFDGEETLRAGARVDWQRNERDHFIFTGEAYRSNLKQQVTLELGLPIAPGGLERDNNYGGFLAANWRRTSGSATSVLQTYVSTSTRNEITIKARSRALGFDFVRHQKVKERFDLVWGSEARYTQDFLNGPVAPSRVPVYNNYLVDGFVQASFSLKPHKLIATVGSKFQDSTLTGFQAQPSARFIWLASAKQSVWGAVSRAVVTPAIQDTQLMVPINIGSYNGLPVQAIVTGNPAFRPEEVVSGEVGYRLRPGRHLSFDLALFHNVDRHIQSLAYSAPTFVPVPSPRLVATLKYGNGFTGDSKGAELAANWRPVPSLQLTAAYTCLRGDVHQEGSERLALVDTFSSPRNTISAAAAWTFRRTWSLGGSLYEVGQIKKPPASGQPDDFQAQMASDQSGAPRYTRLDAQLKRTFKQRGLLEVGGTNLLRPRHVESAAMNFYIVSHQVPRSLFARASWSF